jgi:hypothetical protein
MRRELFRYVRVKQPKVFDLGTRIDPALAALPRDQRERWAREWLGSKQAVARLADLAFDYGAYLAIEKLSAAHLPSRDDLRDPEALRARRVKRDPTYQGDRARVISSLWAAKQLAPHDTAELERLACFVELFPTLDRVLERVPYPMPIEQRVRARRPPVAPVRPPQILADPDAGTRSELAELAQHVDTLWRVRRELLETTRKEHATRVRTLAHAATKGERLRDRNVELVEATRAMRAAPAKTGLLALLDLPATVALPPSSVDALAKAKVLFEKYGIKPEKFCVTSKEVAVKVDTLKPPVGATLQGAGCYKEHPNPLFGDEVRLLGHADLIRVEERLLGYVDGEISYIENILAGEVRKRRVRMQRYFEQTTEITTQQEDATSRESTVTAKHDLSSSIQTELGTRVSSDVNASASGSGGGSLGLVEFKGNGSVGANLGIDLEARTSTEDTSSFSQEIINKALETTRSLTIERRLSRTWSLHDTEDLHKITGGAEPRNGIYRFLDKRVCLTETLYGKRVFLLANLRFPGRNLVCEREDRLLLGLGELGRKPVFDISIDDVHPSTYKELAARFKAANVRPPPPPMQTIGKTYKTETTNAAAEQPAPSATKLGEALTPFFEKYKRFLITDSIRIPDGYEVREVLVTVNHGRNGLSVPAQLPLKLAGATLGAGLTLVTAAAQGLLGPALFVPAAVYQFQFAVSPVMHYNTDSSNVAACVGNETHESPYFFFEPDLLMRQLFDAFGNFVSQSPGLIQALQTAYTTLQTNLVAHAGAAATEITQVVQTAVNGVMDRLRSSFDNGNILETFGGIVDTMTGLVNTTVTAVNLGTALTTMVQPVIDFVRSVLALFTTGLQQALLDLFELMASLSDPVEILPFTSVAGTRGELPVSFNTVAIHPGVTINLTACLARTNDGLDAWKLETYDKLYQAYVQLVADYETKALLVQSVDRIERNPATLRREETLAIKELVCHALNNVHEPPAGNTYTFDKLNLFENAIDWDNLSYRLFNYGPTHAEVVMDKVGVYAGVDERRQAFLKASWAQVLIPLRDDPRLEEQLGAYIHTNAFDFEGDLDDNELAALYTELSRDRARIAEEPPIVSRRHETLPTDLVVLRPEIPPLDESTCEPIP